ncbi:MAG: hypothetical protein WC676_03700 [Candidatus Omnitrophota bacterium]
MDGQKNKIILFSLSAFLFALCFFFQFLTPQVVSWLYSHHHIELLNHITRTQDVQTLAFYIGQSEHFLSGPLSCLFGAWFLIVFFLSNPKRMTPQFFGISIFLFLLITKFPILFYPPYGGDAITGPFAEATWLARHNFDYQGLLQQPSYMGGGAKVYAVSIYPSFLALQMKLIADARWFLFVNHLIVFILAALILRLLYCVFLKLFRQEIAVLLSLAIFSLSLFQSQTEMINMEIPCLFLTVLSAYYLVQEKIKLASLAAIAAVVVKGFGVVACGAVGIITVVLFLFSPRYKFKWPVLLWGLSALLSGIIIVLASKWIIGSGMVGAIKIFSFSLWDDVMFRLFMGIFLLSILNILRIYLYEKKHKSLGSVLFSQENYLAGIFFVYAGMWYAVFMNFTSVIPRYFLLLAPFLFACIFYGFFIVIRSSKAQSIILVMLISILSFSAYGLLEEEDASDYLYIELERSLEYRNVLKRDILLAREIENNFSSYAVGAPPIMGQILGVPELGYVQKKLDVMVYGISKYYDGIREFNGLKGLNLAQTVWIGQEDGFSRSIADVFPFPVDPNDQVLKTIEYGDKSAVIFMGGIAIEKARRALFATGKHKNLSRNSK